MVRDRCRPNISSKTAHKSPHLYRRTRPNLCLLQNYQIYISSYCKNFELHVHNKTCVLTYSASIAALSVNYVLSGSLSSNKSFPVMYTGDECNARTSQQTDASSGGLQRRRPFPGMVFHVRLRLFACSGRSHAIGRQLDDWQRHQCNWLWHWTERQSYLKLMLWSQTCTDLYFLVTITFELMFIMPAARSELQVWPTHIWWTQ